MTNNTAEEAEEATAAGATRTTTEATETEEAGEASASPATLITAEQVAERLSISTRRLRDWRKEGKLAEVGRFKRGTARIPLFDPADVAQLLAAQAAEEASATTVAPVTAVATVATAADRQAFNDAVAKAVAAEVRLVLAEMAEAPEAVEAAVAPLVDLVREQQATIDELRQKTGDADNRATEAEAQLANYMAEEQRRIDAAAEEIRATNAARVLRPSGSLTRPDVQKEVDRRAAAAAIAASDQPLLNDQQPSQERSFWRRVLDRLGGGD